MNLKSYLKKFPAYKKLAIKSIESYKTNGFDQIIHKLELVNSIGNVKSSVHEDIIHNNVKTLHVVDEQLNQIKHIYKRRGIIYAKTKLFLDASKGRIINGKVLNPSKAWLTEEPFSILQRRAQEELRRANQEHIINLLNNKQ